MGEIIKFDFNKGRVETNSPNDINRNPAKKENPISENIPTDREKEIAKLAEPFLKFVEFVLSGKNKELLNQKNNLIRFRRKS